MKFRTPKIISKGPIKVGQYRIIHYPNHGNYSIEVRVVNEDFGTFNVIVTKVINRGYTDVKVGMNLAFSSYRFKDSPDFSIN